MKPRRVVEIGTANGGTLYLWTQVASECAVILSIDLPGGDFGGAYPRCRTAFYRSFARGAQSISMILADSHSPQTRKKVVAYFDGERLDYLFIDGDHTYTGVKCDFQQYGPLVRPGGLIGFHDILPRRDEPGIQVYRLWEELKAKYETWSYVAPEGKGRRIGIGLLRVPDGGVGAVL